jgi:hypothetical protein
MFTVEQAVENWKNELRQKQTVMESDIEELESHLRDEMEQLAPLGLSEEEAFLIAVRRIGDTTQMASEFAKVNTAAIWKNRFFWMVAGVLMLRILSSCANFLSSVGVLLGNQFVSISWLTAGILSVAVQTIILLILLTIFYVIAVKTALFHQGRKRSAVITMVVVFVLSSLLGASSSFFCNFFLVRYCGAEQMGQFAIGSSYSSVATAILWPVLWIAILLWLLPRKTRTI